MFEKFLSRPQQTATAIPKKKAGRPRKETVKQERKEGDRYQANGRVKPKLARKRNNGSKHYKVRRKRCREDMRKRRAKLGMVYERAYNATLRRKWIQNRSIQKLKAKRLGLNPEQFYTITYEEWEDLWLTCVDIYDPITSRLQPATALAGGCLKKGACFVARRDAAKAYTIDNVGVFCNGKFLGRKPPS